MPENQAIQAIRKVIQHPVSARLRRPRDKRIRPDRNPMLTVAEQRVAATVVNNPCVREI
jgi:hypothetical protein